MERLNYLKDDFLNTVSHELRTPMASIKMATQLLEIQLTRVGVLGTAENSSIERYFQVLVEECEREIHLINDLLDLTRLDSNTDPLVLIEVHLESWVNHLSESFIGHIQAQQQELHIDIPADLVVNVDLPYLERILSELLHNACKYTPAGEVIKIWVESRQRQVQFIVEFPFR